MLPSLIQCKERKRLSFPALCGGVYCAVIATACGPSPLAPSPTVNSGPVTLTIAARDAVTGAPLPDIRAFVHNGPSCLTKDDGQCMVSLPANAIVTVAVWGDGYAGTFHTETVSGNVRWTFQLVRE